jgi:ribulose-5-phosphate 4-epimerase/fuculose-1-phosphate aldolase
MGITGDSRAVAEELSAYARLAYDRRLATAGVGTMSVRIPGRDVFLITPASTSLRDVRPDTLVAVDGHGVILDNPAGLGAPDETSLHLGIYRIKPRVNAIVQVHPPHATAFAIARKSIPPVTASAVSRLRRGPVVLEAPGEPSDLARMALKPIQEAPPETTVFLLERHGVAAFGPNLRQAFDDAELAEDTARIAFHLSQFPPVHTPEQPIKPIEGPDIR